MKFTAAVEIEVESDKEFTEAEGKRAAYALASTLNNQVKRGRTPSGPVASVTGIVVSAGNVLVRPEHGYKRSGNTDALE